MPHTHQARTRGVWPLKMPEDLAYDQLIEENSVDIHGFSWILSFRAHFREDKPWRERLRCSFQ